MKTKELFLFILIASIFASCSMVKSPQSANFNRVKYNSHLKLAKADQKEKLPETIKSFEENTELAESKIKLKEDVPSEVPAKTLVASTKTETTKSIQKNAKDLNNVEIRFKKKEKPSLGIFGQARDLMRPISINEYMNKPLPTAVADSSAGNLLYIILVVLLVLIILGLIGDIGGGLIGTLIAVLIILLILRLLGII